MFLFAVLLLQLNAVQYSSCERFSIYTSPEILCPGELAGEPCLSLQQYVDNPSLSSDIALELQFGNHRLDSQLSVLNINTFAMTANTSATVTCNQQLSEPFYFDRLQQIHVSGITLVGCRIELHSITNTTFERNSFMDRTSSGAALLVQNSQSVVIRSCTFSNNIDGAIYGAGSTFSIKQTTFWNNCAGTGGAILYFSRGNMEIQSSNFSSNSVSSNGGGISTFIDVVVTIVGTYFSNNIAGSNGLGGAVYASSGVMTITGTYFKDNEAESHGGAVYFDGGNITVINNTFINNRAITGEGGAIYSARRYTNISLVDNIFNHNTAAYCGVIKVDEFYHYHVRIIGNIFTYNRAISGGGVICIRNASILVLDNIFSHNSAVGDAGVIQVDESDIIIERSIFSNNSAGGNGGVLYTYFYPTKYSIIDSSFIGNQAEGYGGVLFVIRAGSHVTISLSTFGFNNATSRGDIIVIAGSTLEINRANIFENAAEEVIFACNSNVTITSPGLVSAGQDSIYSVCFVYDSLNTTVSWTTEQTTPTTAITTVTEETTSTVAPTEEVTTTDSITETTTRPAVSSASDKYQDTADYNLHYLLPVYVFIGVFAVLLVVIYLLVTVIAVKIFRVKPKSQNVNLSAYEYLAIKNEHSLPEVHVAHT